MSFISQESIDEVSAKTDIVQIVNEYVPLVQKGNDWWGCCPFHSEKTGSFSVSADKKFYYCFGCHEGGTAFNFIMKMENISYPESIEVLAKKCGVKLIYSEGGNNLQKTDDASKIKNEYKDLYTRVANSFHYMLMETDAGKFALDYITKRGLTKETLEKFKIGYSPADRKWLKTFLLKKNYSEEFLNNSGLFSKKYPDISFFNDRLMFPIFDRNGDVVAMGGRFLRGDPTKSPKYLNSSDLVQYKKGSTLYAFNFAKQAIREEKKVIFCEGYMDVIAYHQCGINYAVAPLGTALTEEQILLVKNYVDTILLSFDSDGAGQAATKRAILMCRKLGITVKIIRLTGAKDPAEIMINFGPDTLTNDVKLAILDNDFLLSKLLEVYPKENPEGKAKAAQEFFEYIDVLQSDVQKNACLEQFCQAFQIDLEAAKNDLAHRENLNSRINRNVSAVQQSRPAEQTKIKPTAELRAILTTVADDISLFQKMRNSISVDDLEDPQARKMFIVLEECSRSGNFSISSILNRCESDELRELVIQSSNEYSEHLEQSVNDSILLLRRRSLERKSVELTNRIRRAERSSLPEDKAQLVELLIQKSELTKQIDSIKG